ncbi:DUF2226 domain-containing protein [uncultured Methanobacterium sp.]|uniref:DUF2226 domain-containing protein n=1 Tax=uncultured Methanobacterium sp. TaxID=176306 RepID=UPI002AA92C24|nr:DUF2226 domain-containing protein [uncultured Methanobacterium sp.]
MEMPITKPSMVSYADELDFSKLMEDLASDNKNGFIRVTSRSEEGYILYKNGKQVAASFDRFSKIEALEKISSALGVKNTLIEVFDVGPSQVDYLLDLNKPYAFDAGSNVYDVIGELKKTETPKEPQEETLREPLEETPEKPQEETLREPLEESLSSEEPAESIFTKESPDKLISSEKVPDEDASSGKHSNEKILPGKSPEEEIPPILEESSKIETTVDNSSEGTVLVTEVAEPPVEKIDSTLKEDSSLTESINEPKMDEIKSSHKPVEMSESKDVAPDNVLKPPVTDEKVETPSKVEDVKSSDIPKEEDEAKPIDRLELLKKYGIKDVQDDDVENLLQSYKGGIIDDDDVERVELVLMNLIKKSVLGIPKIKGTEVMVFLDNYKELTGTINIITEYESQGFLNKIMGQSRTATNLRRQIINIAEIAIKKSFRQYPEVVEKFEINVEFS